MRGESSEATLAVAAGQGVVVVRPDGRIEHVSEYPQDEAVYQKHLRGIPERVAEIPAPANRRVILVASGGRTKQAAPDLSEAESFLRSWKAYRQWPPAPVCLDDLALDFGENLFCAAMAARLHLDGQLAAVPENVGNAGLAGRNPPFLLSEVRPAPAPAARVPITRIVMLTAWAFKRRRYQLLTEALGIGKIASFVSFAEARDAADPKAAKHGEARGVARLESESDPLMRGAWCEEKRRRRHIGPSFEERFAQIRHRFPGFFAALEEVQEDRSLNGRDKVAAAFRSEILALDFFREVSLLD